MRYLEASIINYILLNFNLWVVEIGLGEHVEVRGFYNQVDCEQVTGLQIGEGGDFTSVDYILCDTALTDEVTLGMLCGDIPVIDVIGRPEHKVLGGAWHQTAEEILESIFRDFYAEVIGVVCLLV